MENYSDCIEYLHELGIPLELCEKVCKKYEERKDMKGLVDFLLACETMVDSCVD